MQQIALVTGGSRGIGAATALLLAEQGYDLCINYKSNQQAAQKLQQQILALGRRVIIFQADISNEADVVRLFNAIDSELGSITALVNNAGILQQQMRVEDVTGYFLCCREAVKRMSLNNNGQGGAIVNVGSVASRLGGANEYVDYAASKGAIDTLTTGLALEVAGEGIRVNCVRPGLIYTEMHAAGGEPGRVDRMAPSLPMGRGGQPSEVAQAIVWLLSEQASYATGTFVDLAGGR